MSQSFSPQTTIFLVPSVEFINGSEDCYLILKAYKSFKKSEGGVVFGL